MLAEQACSIVYCCLCIIDGDCCCCSLDLSELDLDGEGGCKFLRVMLSLIMHNYPQLVYGALELLFRHFGQRQEVLQAFKQVSVFLLMAFAV